MAVKITCPKCKSPITLPDGMIGQESKCGSCGTVFHMDLVFRAVDSSSPLPVDRQPIILTNGGADLRPQSKGKKLSSKVALALVFLGILLLFGLLCVFLWPLFVPTETFAGKEVVVSISVTVSSNRQVWIKGTTNLPAGTELLIAIEKAGKPHGGQSGCFVSATGSFGYGPF